MEFLGSLTKQAGKMFITKHKGRKFTPPAFQLILLNFC